MACKSNEAYDIRRDRKHILFQPNGNKRPLVFEDCHFYKLYETLLKELGIDNSHPLTREDKNILEFYITVILFSNSWGAKSFTLPVTPIQFDIEEFKNIVNKIFEEPIKYINHRVKYVPDGYEVIDKVLMIIEDNIIIRLITQLTNDKE